MIVCEW